MLKSLFDVHKRTTLLSDAIQEVLDMMERAQRMFGLSCCQGTEEGAVQLLQDDSDINAGERRVRRMVVQHLTMHPEQDLPTSLALISIIHDVERLGDYAKSLIELNQWGEMWSGDRDRARMCQELHRSIAPLFDQVMTALRDSDADLAREVMREHEVIKKRTDDFLKEVIDEPGGGRDPVLFSLACRFLRRISAHLSNVASSVANPLDQVGGKEARP